MKDYQKHILASGPIAALVWIICRDASAAWLVTGLFWYAWELSQRVARAPFLGFPKGVQNWWNPYKGWTKTARLEFAAPALFCGLVSMAFAAYF